MEATDVSQQGEISVEAAEAIDFPSLMEQYLNDPSHDYKTLKYGDVMDGVIMRVDRDEILVDIGSKSEGVVPVREFSSLTSDEKDALAIGDSVLVFVVQPENQEGQAVVSIDRARQEKSWRKLQEYYEANEVIEAEVTNYNKGGLLVNLDGVRGFVPASQVSEIRGGDDASKQADMARLIGTMLPLKVIEINRHRNRLILSERQAVQDRRDVMKERLIEELKEGEVRRGRVSSICDFGAFVDIGGADGLVHLSELSWSRVRHPSEILKVGQEVDVYVLGINAQEKKIALSIKRTQAEPWSQVAAKYEVGQLVRGTVTQLANFGAFARIEDGIEGLIHVSELTDERITHPKQVVKEGDDLLLRIIRIDPQRRRMGLSLRRALDTPDEDLLAVFGEGALEERDRIVSEIHAALEAEGIEIGSGRRDDDEESGEVGARPTEAAPPSETGAATATVEPAEDRVVTSPTPALDRAEREAKERARREERQAPELPADLDTTGLSAMEMAFAMAGAQLDVDNAEAALAAQAAAEANEAVGEAVIADDEAVEAVIEAEVADEIALETVVDALVGDEVALEAVRSAELAEEEAEVAVLEEEIAAEVAVEAVVDAEIADETAIEAVIEAEAADEVAIEAVLEADVAEAVAEEAVIEAEIAENLAVAALLDPSVPEEVVAELVIEAEEAEEIAAEAILDADVAEVIAEEAVLEAEIADEIAVDALIDAEMAEENAVEAIEELEIDDELTVDALIDAEMAEVNAADALVEAEIGDELATDALIDAEMAEANADDAILEAEIDDVIAEEMVIDAESAEAQAAIGLRASASDSTPSGRSRGSGQRHSLTEVKTLEESARSKLNDLGIHTIDDLVARGQATSERSALAKQIGVPVSQLTEWVNRADLMRLTGVGTEFANLLEETGVDSCKELQHRVPENLHASLVKKNDEIKITKRTPTLNDVTGWIAEAKELSAA